jgi:histidinol-phosphate aminotransferase
MSKELSSLSELHCYPSRANFILFKTLKHDANEIFQRLKEQNILIKNLSPQGRALTNCLRVTIGKTNENSAFIVALKKALT